MKTTLLRNAKRGFTLIEILAVIAILGILMSLIATQGPAIVKKAKQTAASNKVRGIVQAAMSYGKPITIGGDATKGQANDVAGYAEVLSRRAAFHKGDAWYVDGDKSEIPTGKTVPESVIENDQNKIREVQPTAWAVVLNAKRQAFASPLHPYPLLWTRGLEASGRWNKDKGVWGEDGGHIAFSDGEVKWYAELQDDANKLYAYNKDTKTSSYQEAIGGDAQAKEDQASGE